MPRNRHTVFTRTYRTPVTLVLGRDGQSLGILVFGDAQPRLEKVDMSADLAELCISGSHIYGHAAVSSFGTSTVKAAGVRGSRAYFLGPGSGARLAPLPSVEPTVRSIKAREFGQWANAWNSVLFLGEIGRDVVIVGPTRAGELLHLNIGVSRPDTLRMLEKALGRLNAIAGRHGGDVSVGCPCRLATMPVELMALLDSRYIMVKLHINDLSERAHARGVVILGEGGKVRYRADIHGEEALVDALDKAEEALALQ